MQVIPRSITHYHHEYDCALIYCCMFDRQGIIQYSLMRRGKVFLAHESLNISTQWTQAWGFAIDDQLGWRTRKHPPSLKLTTIVSNHHV